MLGDIQDIGCNIGCREYLYGTVMQRLHNCRVRGNAMYFSFMEGEGVSQIMKSTVPTHQEPKQGQFGEPIDYLSSINLYTLLSKYVPNKLVLCTTL